MDRLPTLHVFEGVFSLFLWVLQVAPQNWLYLPCLTCLYALFSVRTHPPLSERCLCTPNIILLFHWTTPAFQRVLLNPFDRRGYTLLWAHIIKSSHQLPVLCKYFKPLSSSFEQQNSSIYSYIYLFHLLKTVLFAQWQENWVCHGHCTFLGVKISIVFSPLH